MSREATVRSTGSEAVFALCKARPLACFLIYAACFLFVAAVVPPVNDYRAYLLQWSAVAAGHDPWLTPVSLGDNAYGPLHNLYGLLFLIDPALPRLFGAVLWLTAVWMIARQIDSSGLPRPYRRWLITVLFLNPFWWGWVAVFGSNDAIVAALVVFAAFALSRRASAAAGVWIALAALLKLYPLVAVPFVIWHRRKTDLPFASAAIGLFASGMAVAYAIWGSSIVTPMSFAAAREPSQLSLYAFLTTSTFSPFSGVGVPTLVEQVVFVVSITALWGAHVVRGRSQIEGLVLGLLATLTMYQLGHFQFYLPLLLTILFFVASREIPLAICFPLLALLAAVSIFAIFYLTLGGLVAPPWLVIRQNAGLPTFLIEVGAITALLSARPAAS